MTPVDAIEDVKDAVYSEFKIVPCSDGWMGQL
jgi:hypothetical protein